MRTTTKYVVKLAGEFIYFLKNIQFCCHAITEVIKYMKENTSIYPCTSDFLSERGPYFIKSSVTL